MKPLCGSFLGGARVRFAQLIHRICGLVRRDGEVRMGQLVYQLAREEASRILLEHWDGRLPVRLGEITQALGAQKFETSLGPTLSGLVTKECKQAPRIVLNSDEPVARRRFTWAHELGHIVERDDATDHDYSFTEGRGLKYDLHEFFADEFAGALLMPVDEIVRMRDEGKTPGQMARIFDVSVRAVTTRLKRLEKKPA